MTLNDPKAPQRASEGPLTGEALVVPGPWQAVEPHHKPKAPWSASPGSTWEGTVLRYRGNPPIVVAMKHCGHQHLTLLPARKCSNVLARKLNRQESQHDQKGP
jgi:hypothetical protein